MSQKKDPSLISRASSYLNDKKNRPVIVVGLIIVFLLIGFTLLYVNQQRKIDALEDKVTDIKKDSRMEKKKKVSPKPLSPSPASRQTDNAVNTNQAQQVQNQNQNHYQQDSQETAFQENVPCVYMRGYSETRVENETTSVSLNLKESTSFPLTVEIVGSNNTQMETIATATFEPGKDTWSGYVRTKPYMTHLSYRDSCYQPSLGDGSFIVRDNQDLMEIDEQDSLPTPNQGTQEFEDAVMLCITEKASGEAYESLKQDCANELGYDVNSTIEEEQTQISDCRGEKVTTISQDCNAQYEHLR